MKHDSDTMVSRLARFSEYYSYSVIAGFNKGLKLKGGLSFVTQFFPLTQEQRFLKNFNLKGKIVYDIGGYIGFVTGFFSLAVGKDGRVITFEPNPLNCNKIRQIISLNNFRNVELICSAIGEEKGEVDLCFCAATPAEGSIDLSIQGNIKKNKNAQAIHVLIDSLDNKIREEALPVPDFIKIDVEGFEIQALNGMKETIEKYRPLLFIEIHGSDLDEKSKNVYGVINFLSRYQYIFYHVESEKEINFDNFSTAIEGHLFAWQR